MESNRTISGSWIVDEISNLNINSIPESWYKVIRQKRTPHAMAILILWDLLYWYKWTEIRDEGTGRIIGYKKKFKADLLQRSYSAIAEKFGITKSNAADIIYFLEQLGVLKRHFRTVKVGDTKMGNVLYIELNPAKIKEISEVNINDYHTEENPKENDNCIPMQEKPHTYADNSPEVYGKSLQTNTIITQSNSQSNSQSVSSASAEKKVKKPKKQKEDVDGYLSILSEKERDTYHECVSTLYKSLQERDSHFIRNSSQLKHWEYDLAIFGDRSNRSPNEILKTLKFALKDDYWFAVIFGVSQFIKNYEKIFAKSKSPRRTGRSYDEPHHVDLSDKYDMSIYCK